MNEDRRTGEEERNKGPSLMYRLYIPSQCCARERTLVDSQHNSDVRALIESDLGKQQQEGKLHLRPASKDSEELSSLGGTSCLSTDRKSSAENPEDFQKNLAHTKVNLSASKPKVENTKPVSSSKLRYSEREKQRRTLRSSYTNPDPNFPQAK